MFAVVK